MTILSEENLIRVLDMLCTNPSPTKAARAIGGGDKLIWQWGTKSAAQQAMKVPIEESGFGVHWPDPDGPLVWFHEAFQQASTIFFALASMEHTALIGPDAGHKRVARDGSGRIQFKVDLKVASDAMRMDDTTWELCYGDRPKTDIFERDENGCLVPDVYTEPLPAQLRIHLLRSLLPSQFNPENRTTSEVIANGGVLVLGEQKEKPRSAIREDLEERLAKVLANPNRPSAKPNAPVTIMGRGEDGPKERVNNTAGDDAARPLDQHPRAYVQPALPAPKPEAPTDYRRPTRNLNAVDRPGGRMPPGGFDSKGRPT